MSKVKDIAISVKGVSKTFRIPHEKVTSLRSAAVGAFKRKGGYEEFKALDDVSFEVKKGEFFGIIGRNGSGKSTLLKILAGIYQPDKGKVKINGMISPFLELGIGFNPELSGRDNIYLNATVLGMTKKQIDAKFDDIVKFSELERFIDQKLKNYSSGMQVRLAFSVSIHANREILLMDEVLAVGDSNFQSKCLEEFNKYRDMGKTVVLISHDIGTIRQYCDKVLLLRNGKIVKMGDAVEVCKLYLEQNMDDEDNRINKSVCHENKKDGNGKNKVAEITKIQYLNSEGNESSVFKTGENMSVRVYFRIEEIKEIFNFGLSIFNIRNEYMFGVNTIFDNIDTRKIIERGFYQVEIKNIPFTTNTYFINTSIAGETFQIRYDIAEKTKLFKVFFDSRNEGIVNAEYKWI